MFVISVFYFILEKTFQEAKPHTNIQANDRSDKGKCSKAQFMVSSSGVRCIFHLLFNTILYSFVAPSVWCIIKYPKAFLCYSLLLLLLFRFFLWTWNEFVIMVRIYTTPVMKVLHKAVNLPGLRCSLGIFTELFVDCGKALLSRESSTHWSSSAQKRLWRAGCRDASAKISQGFMRHTQIPKGEDSTAVCPGDPVLRGEHILLKSKSCSPLAGVVITWLLLECVTPAARFEQIV